MDIWVRSKVKIGKARLECKSSGSEEHLDMVRKDFYVEGSIKPSIRGKQHEVLKAASVHIGVSLHIIGKGWFLSSICQESRAKTLIEQGFHTKSWILSHFPEGVHQLHVFITCYQIGGMKPSKNFFYHIISCLQREVTIVSNSSFLQTFFRVLYMSTDAS